MDVTHSSHTPVGDVQDLQEVVSLQLVKRRIQITLNNILCEFCALMFAIGYFYEVGNIGKAGIGSVRNTNPTFI